jgi:hypothetical protein
MSQQISPIRRTILLVIAVTMIAGGLWLLYEQFTVSTIIYGRFLLAGGALVFVGFVLLWEDFVAPLLGRKMP